MEAPIYFIHTVGVGLEDRHYHDLEQAKDQVDTLKRLAGYRHYEVRIIEFYPSNIVDHADAQPRAIVWAV